MFYMNYFLYYVNIRPQIEHDLVTHNNKVERMKPVLLMKCRNFISGLHILALSLYLHKENKYILLYCTAENPYYHMEIFKCFIIKNVLYMTISLPLKHEKVPIVSLYGLYSYYMSTNMLDYKFSLH